MSKLIPAWVFCEMCEDFMCNIHHEHVADCPCPEIEVWAAQDLDPYSPCVDDGTRKSPLEFNE